VVVRCTKEMLDLLGGRSVTLSDPRHQTTTGT
jgi:hypothetical protein